MTQAPKPIDERPVRIPITTVMLDGDPIPPDGARGPALPKVPAPTQRLIGGDDVPVLGTYQKALVQLPCEASLEIVQDASRLFEELGTREQGAGRAARWFERHLAPRSPGGVG